MWASLRLMQSGSISLFSCDWLSSTSLPAIPPHVLKNRECGSWTSFQLDSWLYSNYKSYNICIHSVEHSLYFTEQIETISWELLQLPTLVHIFLSFFNGVDLSFHLRRILPPMLWFHFLRTVFSPQAICLLSDT